MSGRLGENKLASLFFLFPLPRFSCLLCIHSARVRARLPSLPSPICGFLRGAFWTHFGRREREQFRHVSVVSAAAAAVKQNGTRLSPPTPICGSESSGRQPSFLKIPQGMLSGSLPPSLFAPIHLYCLLSSTMIRMPKRDG